MLNLVIYFFKVFNLVFPSKIKRVGSYLYLFKFQFNCFFNICRALVANDNNIETLLCHVHHCSFSQSTSSSRYNCPRINSILLCGTLCTETNSPKKLHISTYPKENEVKSNEKNDHFKVNVLENRKLFIYLHIIHYILF